MALKCPECLSEVSENTNFCSHCGAVIKIPSFFKLSRGQTISGRYEIIEELGSGGMGIVYRVYDKKTDEELTLKLIRPEIASDKKTIERFRNELKLARKIAHRNVGKMYDINEEKGMYYLTMEYIPGQNLEGLIKQTGRLTIGRAISITKQICLGLGEAHRLGVIHRDLKPSNIMIDKNGNAQIMDFGVARSIEAKGITAEGSIVGTPAYISPELVEGKKVDKRSDVYSLGVLLFEMTTGKTPFQGETPLRIAVKHKTELPPNPKSLNNQISENLNNLILKCLEKDRKKRVQSTEEFLSELNLVEKDITTDERDKPEEKRQQRDRDKKKIKKIFVYTTPILFALFFLVVALSIIKRPDETLDSVAVLPFSIIGEQTDLESLSDGLTESISNHLAQLPSLALVIARSSVFKYKGQDIDPQTVGAELGVDTLVIGRMGRRGDEISIYVELVNVEDNRLLWGHQYAQNISEIFSVQKDIEKSIIDNLRLKLTGEELQLLARSETENPDAFEAYSKGNHFWSLRTGDNLQKAIKFFKQAIEIDPNYALAYAGLANSYILLPEYAATSPQEAFPQAEQASRKAIELDNNLAEAHVALAQMRRRYLWDWDGAEREYKRAIELNPGSATAHHWYAYDLMCQTRFEESIAEIERAHELDPLSFSINRNRGQIYYRSGQYEKAVQILQDTLEIQPDFIFAHFHIGSILLQQGMYEDAIVEFEIELENAVNLEAYVLPWIGIALLKLGQENRAQEIFKELMEISRRQYVSQTVIAIKHFSLGDIDLGFEWLDRAFQAYDVRLSWLNIEPVFDDVRLDPRFQAILQKVGLSR